MKRDLTQFELGRIAFFWLEESGLTGQHESFIEGWRAAEQENFESDYDQEDN